MSDGTKKCPFCGEEILAMAKKCKHCNEFIPDDVEALSPSENVEATDNATVNAALNYFNTIVNLIKTNKKAKGVAITLASIIVLMFFAGNSSVMVLPGCTLENHTETYNYKSSTFYCKNKYYDKFSMAAYGRTNLPSYYVYKNGNLLVERMRSDGDYYCKKTTSPEKYENCSESQFKKLTKEASKEIEKVVKLNEEKFVITQSASMLTKVRESFLNDDSLNHGSNVDFIAKLKDLAKVKETQGNYVVMENNVLIALAPDGRMASIYNNVQDPKYFITIVFEEDSSNRWGTFVRYSIGEDVVRADEYVKNPLDIRRFTEQEIKAEKIYK